MPKFAMIRLLTVLLLGLAMSGCGFRLAGDASLPPELNRIYLVTSGFSDPQRRALQRQLERAGAEVTRQADSQAVRLGVSLQVMPDRRLATGASNGRLVDRLARGLQYNLKGTDGKLLAPAGTLTLQKDIVLDDDNLLSSGVEKRNAIEDLEQSLYNQLIHRLKRIEIGT